MLAFGLPAADENDIVAAVRFALDAREAASAPRAGPIRTASGRTRRSRSASASAPGRRASTAPADPRYQVLGNAVEQAIALARHAPPGQILVAGAAAPLAAVHYLLREERGSAGTASRSACHRVLGPRLRPRRRRPRPGSAFVGREVELRAVRDLWREVLLRGAQRSVLVAGEPGVGKTRLVDEFLQKPRARRTGRSR